MRTGDAGGKVGDDSWTSVGVVAHSRCVVMTNEAADITTAIQEINRDLLAARIGSMCLRLFSATMNF